MGVSGIGIQLGQTYPHTNAEDHGHTPLLDESKMDNSLSPMHNRSQIDSNNAKDFQNSRKVSQVRHTTMHTRIMQKRGESNNSANAIEKVDNTKLNRTITKKGTRVNFMMDSQNHPLPHFSNLDNGLTLSIQN